MVTFLKSILDVLMSMLATVDWSQLVPASFAGVAKELAAAISKLYNIVFPPAVDASAAPATV